MAKMKDILIEFKDLSKNFGSFTAVNKINFSIFQGEILGFLGPNGAGKSTTMKMMANLLRPTDGEILIRHNGNLEKLTSNNYDVLLGNVGFLVETPAFYEHMTPRQHLTYFAKLKGYPRDQIATRVEHIIAQMNMKEWIDKPIKTFSKGMRQKIGILAAIVHDPAVVVLDEPSSGLDPQASRELRDFIVKLKEQGKTIFLSSHLLFEISEIVDRVAVIMHGHLLACDTLENLKKKAQFGTIRMELLSEFTSEAANKMIAQITSIIRPLTGLSDSILQNKRLISYNPENRIFEILFNGDRTQQYAIMQALLKEGLEIIDFSVPKASLLESLYLTMMEQADKQQQITKESIQIKAVL
jgi:ABC-2 type transport system ATP-binding protein